MNKVDNCWFLVFIKKNKPHRIMKDVKMTNVYTD